MLLHLGAGVNVPSPDGQSPLGYAVKGYAVKGTRGEAGEYGAPDLAIVRILLAHGADVHQLQTQHGWVTPLSTVVERASTAPRALLMMLLAAGDKAVGENRGRRKGRGGEKGGSDDGEAEEDGEHGEDKEDGDGECGGECRESLSLHSSMDPLLGRPYPKRYMQSLLYRAVAHQDRDPMGDAISGMLEHWCEEKGCAVLPELIQVMSR